MAENDTLRLSVRLTPKASRNAIAGWAQDAAGNPADTEDIGRSNALTAVERKVNHDVYRDVKRDTDTSPDVYGHSHGG